MKTMYKVIAALGLVTTVSMAPDSASAQAKMCSNGLSNWANAAFNPREPGNYRCDGKVTQKKFDAQSSAMAQARAHAKAQAQAQAQAQAKTQAAIEAAPQLASLPKPPTGKKNRVAAAAKYQVGDDSDVPNSVRLAEPVRQANGSTNKSTLCRRYLASTGQTVEVPCGQ